MVFSKSFRCPKKTPKPSTQSSRRGEVKVNASQWISSRVAIWMDENGHVRICQGLDGRSMADVNIGIICLLDSVHGGSGISI